MASRKIFLYKTFKYFLFFLLFLVLGFAEISGMHPFMFGMLFALVWCNQKIYIISPLYLLSGMIVDFSVQNIICLCATCFVFVLFYLLHKKFQKPLTKLLIGLYAFVSQGAYLFLNSFSGEAFFRAICSVVVGMICLYSYLFLMQSLHFRGLRRKLLLDESICAGILFLALGVGFCSIPDYCGLISKFLLVTSMLVLFLCLQKEHSLAFSIMLSIGSLLHCGDYATFLTICVMAMVLLITANSKRIFACLGICLVDIFVNLYFFNFYDIYLFLPTVFAAAISFCIPKNTIKKIRNHFIYDGEQFAERTLINRTQQKIAEKLFQIGLVFKEMQNIYLSMSKKNLTPDDAIDYVLGELNFSVCKKCSNKSCPYSQIMQTDEDLKTLIALAISRGSISIVDVPSSIVRKCPKVVSLLNSINSLSKEFREVSVINSGVATSRMLLADQLLGVQDVLKSVSRDIKKKVGFDFDLEQKIVEEMLLQSILCSEAVVCFVGEKIESITLCVKTKSINNKKIENLLFSLTKMNMQICDVEKAEKPGFSILTAKRACGYDVVFGSAVKTKFESRVSGDNFSVTRIGDNRVFMSVCDGMGSGSDANSISKLSLNLIEKFYEAGFGGNLVIKNVNKLLSLRDEDSFSAIDICVFDLNNASCSLIKIGASLGFVKQKEQTILVETSALPLGILESIKPSVNNYALSDGDMVILLSDGVVDAWENVLDLKNLINNTSTQNPQILADVILKETLKLTQDYAEDDMTVLVGKIWQKI